MTDGPTEANDVDKTEANKDLVRAFVDDILVNGRLDKLAGYFDGDHYVQHNPHIGDGLSGLGRRWRQWRKAGITMKYDKIHKVLGEGNFVLVVSEGDVRRASHVASTTCSGSRTARSPNIGTDRSDPARSDWKNDNGKFGF